MTWNQPLRFVPIYQTRVWGGRNLESKFGRKLPDPTLPYGESWEICDRPEAVSQVCEGDAAGLTLHDLWQKHRRAVFGEALVDHPSERYPLLMKILDACEDLSIQVHPPAEVAQELRGEAKTEMWFITHSALGARLYAGLRAGATRALFEKALADGSVAKMLHHILPQPGDSLYLPSGRVHAIGAGLVLFEIQQNSDTTYRVFDWNRTGLDGLPRALHVEASLRSLDFEDFEPQIQPATTTGVLVNCPFFEVKKVAYPRSSIVGQAGEHLTVVIIRGSLTVQNCILRAGDFALIPACMEEKDRQILAAEPQTEWLEVRIPRGGPAEASF